MKKRCYIYTRVSTADQIEGYSLEAQTERLRECNEISQDFYDAAMDSIQTSQMECSCGHSGCLVWHGAYTRSLKTALGVWC